MAHHEHRFIVSRFIFAALVLGGGYLGLCLWSADHLPATVFVAQAGFSVDAERSIAGLTGFTLDPRTVWGRLTGSLNGPMVTRTDDDALTARLTAAAPKVDVAATEGAVTFPEGRVAIDLPKSGYALDVPGTKLALRRAFPDQTMATAVVTEVTPVISEAAVQRAGAEAASRAVSGPVLLVSGTTRAQLAPSDFAPALSMVPDQAGGLSLAFDEPRLAGLVASKITVDSKPPTPAARTVTINTVPSRADFTTEDATKAGVKDLVVDFTSPFPPEDTTRTHNLVVSSRTINGTYVPPGGTFSLNGILGERTTAKGYADGTVIINGRLTRGTGGGISQVSTTIYNLAYFAGADILDFTPHAFFIPRYPEGREATVYWPSVDNRWKNNTPHGMLLQTWIADGKVHGRVWSTKTWDIKSVKGERRNVKPPRTIRDNSATCYPQQPQPGFDVTVTRQFYRPGSSTLVKSEPYTTHYIPEDRIICTDPNARP